MRVPRPALVRAVLLSAAPLMGCAQSPPAVEIPPYLLTAPAPPVPPENPDDPTLARWILDLSEAGEACRTNLEAIRRIVTR